MKYSAQEVIQYVQEEDIKFIRLAFCDVFGRQKNISIMPGELKRAFSQGIAFDASAVKGFSGDIHSDLFLFPDPETLCVLPWRPEHGGVVRMFCTVKYPDGRIFENDARSILIKAVEDAGKEGCSFSFGSELEFYLFKLDENGIPTKIPYDDAGYFDIAPTDKGENVRREICLSLERMGISPECSHHEEGPGQNEIDFRYSDALKAADNAVTFKSVVQTIAARNGLFADFSPKPLKDKPGNGFHINLSVKTAKDEAVSQYIIAGILENISGMTRFLNPTAQSYERLGQNKAPGYISWSGQNRSQLIRIPAATGEFVRTELRSPDPEANPYIAFALIIRAALEGIKNKTLLCPPADFNLYNADEETLSRYKKLPSSVEEATSAALGSEFIRKNLPESMLNIYSNL